MLTPETLRRIHRIELRSRRLVNDVFAGAYHSAFKGRGIEFDSVLPYEPGDDIRHIHWNITARTGQPYVKRFIEERELTALLVLDASASCFFGSSKQQKHDQAVELGAIIALSATRNQDRIGLMLFTDQIEHYVPARKGRHHVLRIIRDLMAFSPQGTGTDLGLALDHAYRVMKRRALVFVISDFLAPPSSYANSLSLLGHRHQVVTIILTDPLEYEWPEVGLVNLRDAETGQLQSIDTSDARWRSLYQQQARRLQATRENALRRARVDTIELRTDQDSAAALLRLFQSRT